MSGGTSAVRGCPSLDLHAGTPEPGSVAGIASHRWPLVDCLEFGSLPTAAGCARLHTKNVLLEWQLGDLADDAETLVSELVTNALKASWSPAEIKPIALHLLANNERLIIEVWDRNPTDPVVRDVDDETEHGRGLAVVEALSNRWGCKRVSFNLKVVWCELVLADV
jgi:anti-sigma regulatory factor (Ser/Thr protein kinase)